MHITKEIRKTTPQQPNKRKSNKILKCTHLYLQEKYLKAIPKLSPSRDTAVIYLYKNNIEKIDDIYGFTNLTSLYLQHNSIIKLENLQNLKRLKRLFIGHNRISVLEGLENLSCLEELHIEKQDLPEGVPLCIDPRTVQALSDSLKIFNISHNQITSLKVLSPLARIRYIDASQNDLDDIQEVLDTIKNWYYLREAIFIGNSFTKKHHYREDIIANTLNLEILDNKIVSEVSRTFIKILERQKLSKNSEKSINLAASVPGFLKYHPPPLQKAVSVSLLRSIKSRKNDDLIFDERDAPFISWRALPKRKQQVRMPQNRSKNTIKKQEVVVNTLQLFKK